MTRRSTQPATKDGTTVRPAQRNDILTTARIDQPAKIAKIDCGRGDRLREISKHVRFKVDDRNRFRLTSGADTLLATAIVWLRRLRVLGLDTRSQVINDLEVTRGITAAIGRLGRTIASPATTGSTQ